MIAPVIAAVSAAVGGAEGAATVILPAVATEMGVTAVGTTSTAIEAATIVANPLAAEATKALLPNIAGSSANALKGVDALAKMPDPLISTKSPIVEVVPKIKPELLAANDAVVEAKAIRLLQLREVQNATTAEIAQLEQELGVTKDISPRVKMLVLSAMTVDETVKRATKNDEKQ